MWKNWMSLKERAKEYADAASKRIVRDVNDLGELIEEAIAAPTDNEDDELFNPTNGYQISCSLFEPTSRYVAVLRH